MHALLAARAEEMREARGDLRALGLFGGKKDEKVGIVAAQPGDELAVAQNDFGVGGAGEDARRDSQKSSSATGRSGQGRTEP